jgi:hypothetical protein
MVITGTENASMSTAEVQTIISRQSGWSVHVDSLHTSASPQTITEGSMGILSNNSNLVIDSQLPTDATVPMWDSVNSKFRPIKLNDYYTWIVRFKAKNTRNAAGYFNLGVDIGGAFNTIFIESHLFIRGADVEQTFNIKMEGYSGADFMANGGLIKLTSFAGITTVYEKEFHILREHKGRV